MPSIQWSRLVAVAALLLPSPGRAQGTPANVREIASLPGVPVNTWAGLPGGRVLPYVVDDSVMAYDLAAKRSTLITRGFFDALRVSRSGDRIAFGRLTEDNKRSLIWSMPIDPKTGAARGPAQRSPTADRSGLRASPGKEPGWKSGFR